MGTLRCEEARGRTYTNNYQPDGTNQITAERIFVVQSDNNSEGAKSILATLGLPDPGDPHPEDNTIFADRATARQRTDDPKIWNVVVAYGDQVTRGLDGAWPNPDPTLQPMRVSYGNRPFLRLADGSGQWDKGTGRFQFGLLNGAGEPFDPQPELDDNRTVFTFTDNVDVAVFDWVFLEPYINTTNENTQWGRPVNNFFMRAITASDIQTVTIDATGTQRQYRVVQYVVEVNRDGWDLKILNQGHYTYVDPNTPSPQIAVTESGDRYYFEDGGGNPIQALLGPESAPNAQDSPFLPFGDPPVWIRVKREEVDWTPLGLVNPYVSPPV